MLDRYAKELESIQSKPPIKMKDRQLPLCATYVENADAARIVDFAKTSSSEIGATLPLNTQVAFCDRDPTALPIGVHKSVGGDGDFPTPGDILCGAIASCLDSTLRIVSNRVGVRLKRLEVAVRGTVDVRGTLRVDRKVPVGFQKFEVEVLMKASGLVPGKLLDKLLKAAETSCIVVQSLRGGAEITITRITA